MEQNLAVDVPRYEVTRERLQESAKAQGWPELAVPRKILRLESLPLLGTGKVNYVSLKKLAEGA